jgi:serine/threonine-protein kinase
VRLSAGEKLGHYEILALISSGGMGEVYRAHDHHLERDIALKILPEGLLADEAARKQFRQEALALSKLNHPNIATVFDFDSHNGTDFLAMELIDGTPLADLLREPLPENEVRRLGIQLSEGLSAAHEQGVIHRDLKPANLIVTRDGRLKILDFGIAVSIHPERDADVTRTLSTPGLIAGTLPYMAPEQLRGMSVDARSDIYSAGSVLYEMATGRRAYPQSQSVELIGAILHQPPTSPATLNLAVTQQLQTTIMKALEKDPAQRYQSARELRIALQDADAGAGQEKMLPARGRRYKITTRWAVTLAVLLATALFVMPQIRRFIFGSQNGLTRNSAAPKYVAILPFRVLGDRSLQYVADGIVEHLSAKLFSLKDVHLASPSAAARVNPSDPIDKVAQALGAKLVVQGNLQTSADRIAVVVSLDEAVTGRRLWNQEFSGLKQDLLTLQEHVYAGLVSALDLRLTNEENARNATELTQDISAYDLYMQGLSLIRGRRDEKTMTEALAKFSSAVGKDPNFAVAHSELAETYISFYILKKDSSWLAKASEAANRGRMLNDSLPQVHITLGNVYSIVGKHAEAIAELKRAIVLAPNSDEAYRRLGRVYMSTGNKDLAIQSFQKAVDCNPYYWPNYNLLGAVYVQYGDLERALKTFQRVTELVPGDSVGWTNVGAVYLQLGQWHDSISALQKASKLKPATEVYSNLGTAFFYLGDYKQALSNYEAAVQLSPREAVAIVNLADGYRALGEHDKAVATYDRAIALTYELLRTNPRNASALGLLGVSYAKKGDAKSGLEFIRRARVIDPAGVGLIYDEAIINAVANRMPQALQLVREALSKGYSVNRVLGEPDFKALREQSEFQAMLKRTRQ